MYVLWRMYAQRVKMDVKGEGKATVRESEKVKFSSVLD